MAASNSSVPEATGAPPSNLPRSGGFERREAAGQRAGGPSRRMALMQETIPARRGCRRDRRALDAKPQLLSANIEAERPVAAPAREIEPRYRGARPATSRRREFWRDFEAYGRKWRCRIGGRVYSLACNEGERADLEALAARSRPRSTKSDGGFGEARSRPRASSSCPAHPSQTELSEAGARSEDLEKRVADAPTSKRRRLQETERRRSLRGKRWGMKDIRIESLRRKRLAGAPPRVRLDARALKSRTAVMPDLFHECPLKDWHHLRRPGMQKAI